MSKYNSKKSNGFDSKMENDFNEMLLERKIEFEKQKTFILQEKYELKGEKIKAIKYTADFVLTNLEIVIDVKGFATPDFKLKQKIFGKVYNKKIHCLTKCPTKYNEFNKEALFSGWIDYKLLEKLRKKQKINKGGN